MRDFLAWNHREIVLVYPTQILGLIQQVNVANNYTDSLIICVSMFGQIDKLCTVVNAN